MKQLKWLPSFEFGVKEIDDEHRQMFDILVLLQDPAEKHEMNLCSRLVRLVDRFLTVSVHHFKNEEEFLMRVGFPGVDEHRKYHERLLSQAQKLRGFCDKKMEIEEILDCYLETVHLLIGDFRTGDMQFKSFLDHHRYSRY